MDRDRETIRRLKRMLKIQAATIRILEKNSKVQEELCGRNQLTLLSAGWLVAGPGPQCGLRWLLGFTLRLESTVMGKLPLVSHGCRWLASPRRWPGARSHQAMVTRPQRRKGGHGDPHSVALLTGR